MLDLPEVMALRVYATFLVYQLREHGRDDRGAVSIAEVVIITAILAAAAIAIMAIIVRKFTDKANAIPTE